MKQEPDNIEETSSFEPHENLQQESGDKGDADDTVIQALKEDASTKKMRLKMMRRHNPSLESTPLLSPSVTVTNYGNEEEAVKSRPSKILGGLPYMSFFQGTKSQSARDVTAPSKHTPFMGLLPLPPQKERPQSKGKKLWNRLQAHVKDGDFLLEEQAVSRVSRNRQSLHKEKQDMIRSDMNFSLTQCVLAIILYEVLSVIFYSVFLEPKWTFIDSLYFAVTTFTTVGYGDTVPSSSISKLFTCFYAITGVACLGLALGVIGSNLIESKIQEEETVDEMNKFRAMTLFDYRSSQGVTSPKEEEKGGDDLESGFHLPHSTAVQPDKMQSQSRFMQTWARVYKAWKKFSYRRLIVLLVPLFIIVKLIGPDWDVISMLYFFVVTGSTIGYGDFTPATQTEKALAIVFIPFACGVTGAWLSMVAGYIMNGRSRRFREAFDAHDLCMEDLYIMDEDGDGRVTRAEFLEFMLVAMNKIDEGLVEELRASFDRLDASCTGVLTKQTLVNAAKKKLKCSRRKLELCRYKKKLQDQAQRADLRNRKRTNRQHNRIGMTDTIRRLSIINFAGFGFDDSDDEDGPDKDDGHDYSQVQSYARPPPV